VTESPIEIFQRQFPAIVALVERSDSYRIDITLPHELIGVGASATVIIKHRNGRGFGMTWHLATAQLHGLRSRCFDGTKPDDHPANADWLGELARRLSTDGATNEEVFHSLSHKWKQSRHHVKKALHRRAF
jgi:hypothetical protein